MKLFKKSLLFLILSCFTASCATDHLLELSRKENFLKSRSDYNGYLALEYLQFSHHLLKNGAKDAKQDSQYFAKKGLKIAANTPYIPENPITWNADRMQLEELISMQKRMEDTLQTRIRRNLPIQMAHLSYLYDCWAAKESKVIFRAAELAKCRSKFYKLLGEIEYYIDDLRKDKRPKTIITEPKFTKFEVLFDLNNHKLNDKAIKVLLKLLTHLESLEGNYRLLVVGNTDRVGSKLYNQHLAFRRSQQVNNYLSKNGVPHDAIKLRSLGEDFPDILTVDGMQQKHNRSVGIYILKGADSFDSFPLPLIENIIYRKDVKKARVKRGLTN